MYSKKKLYIFSLHHYKTRQLDERLFIEPGSLQEVYLTALMESAHVIGQYRRGRGRGLNFTWSLLLFVWEISTVTSLSELAHGCSSSRVRSVVFFSYPTVVKAADTAGLQNEEILKRERECTYKALNLTGRKCVIGRFYWSEDFACGIVD